LFVGRHFDREVIILRVRWLREWHEDRPPHTVNLDGAAITTAGIEPLRRIHHGQFALVRLRLKNEAAPALWKAVLGCIIDNISRASPTIAFSWTFASEPLP
jgi:hypothetical protein